MSRKGDNTYKRRPRKGPFAQFKEVMEPILNERHRMGFSSRAQEDVDVQTQGTTVPATQVPSHEHRSDGGGGTPSGHRSGTRHLRHPIVTTHPSDNDIYIDDIPSSMSQTAGRPRMRISPHGNTFIPAAATRLVTPCFTTHFKPYSDWSFVSPSDLQQWWRVFERSCEWDPIHHNEVYRVWNILGAQHYRSMMLEIRRVKDPIKRRAKANFMSDAAYAEMEAYWVTPEFIQKSAKFKAMQATMTDEDSQSGSCSVTYTEGSISMSAHQEQMREKDHEKKDPGLFKVLQVTHKMKNEKYVSKRCEEVATRISAEIEEQTQQEDGIEVIDELAIISTASGGRMRGRVFGLRSKQCVIPGRRQPGPIPPIDITQTSQFNEQVQKIMAEENARRDAEYERKFERIKRRHRVEMEAQRAVLEANRAQLEIICRSLNLPCPPAQLVPHYPDDSDSEDEKIVGTP